MKFRLLNLLVVALLLTMGAAVAIGQVSTVGRLSGTVADPTGAVVVNATVTLKNNATGAIFTAQTSDSGTFQIPSLASGDYTATVTATGFKKSEVTGIKINVDQQSDIKVQMEVGAIGETVIVIAGNDNIIQTQSATVGSTIVGRQITELPYASRNALDLVLFMPGTNTVGRPRQSSVNGLPKSMINITLDGVNIQDNVLKGSDGFFTLIQPRTDAIGEVSMSTATPGAESNAEGAVQIKFATRSGSNDFHGSLYEEHRDKSLNSNFFWNNELLAPKAHFGQPSSPNDAAPRTPALLNQFGGRIGGPITIPHVFNGKDRAFFFINYEEYRLPEANLRTRTILSATAAAGIFTVSGGAQTNLYTLAAANGFTSTPDPTILALINSTRNPSLGTITHTNDLNIDQLTFTNTGGQKRQFPTGRFDFEVNKRNHIEFIENYQIFRSVVDFLNNADPFAPGFPNHGAQNSNRFSTTAAWRTTITPSLINEARFGFQNGVVLFFPENDSSQFANQGGFSQAITTAASGISNVTTINSPQRRNTPTNQFSDNLNYTRGKHTFNFGGDLSSISTFLVASVNGAVPTINYGTDSGDTALNAIFTAFSSSSTVQAQANSLYRVLVGRVNNVTHVASLNEAGTAYSEDGNQIQRFRQREIGMYAQDQWRFKSNLTLNFGLRYEMQYAPISQNQGLTQNTYAGLFGLSGVNGLFVPGATGGALTSFTPLPEGQHLYNRQKGNFAPTIGFAWQPNFKSGVLKRLAGNPGQTVIRGGWSLAFDREGLNLASSIVGANFGGTQNLVQIAGAPGSFARGTLFRALPAAPAVPALLPYPLIPIQTQNPAANAFLPNLKTPYVISFSGGIQRELSKDTVIEVQYVGNRGHQLLRQFNLNETNIVENGFLNEFKLAQANLAANVAAGRGSNFKYAGPGTGTSPLPTYFAYFQGVGGVGGAGATANYTSANWASTTYTSRMTPSNEGAITNAANLALTSNNLYLNAIAAGFAANYFNVNPQVLGGGSFLVNNDGKTWYDSMTIDLRRRLSHGVLFDMNYTMSRALGNEFVSSAIAFLQPATLRNTWLNKDYSPFDIRQSFKSSFIAELPMGRGKSFLGNSHGVVNALLADWAINGTLRVQSGAPLNLGNVQVVGMTRKQLEDAIQIRKDPNHLVYWLPQDIIDNSRRAANTCIAGTLNCTANGYGTANLAGGLSGGDPTGRYIAPSGANGCISAFTGQCGFTNLIIHGPRFTRADLGIAKKWKFSESKNLEFRFEFLNAFKNTDFKLGSYQVDTVAIGAAGIPTFSSASFGQLLGSDTAYRDTSTTNDPGGRVGQIILRFNF